MKPDDIKKMQEVASRLTREESLKMVNERKEIIDSKMEEIKQQEIEQDKIFLEELSDEEREEVFMVLH